MLLVKLITVILTPIALVAVSIVQDKYITARRLSKLEARDIPNCPQQPGYENPPPASENARRKRDLEIDQNADKPPGWIPSLCPKHFWVCITLEKDVTYVSEGKPGSGHVDQTFWRPGGTSIQALWWWQGTVQYTAPGGTVNIYPAHGNTWICVKGGMMVHVFSGDAFAEYRGNENNREELVCKCHWRKNSARSSDDDITIFAKAPKKIEESIKLEALNKKAAL